MTEPPQESPGHGPGGGAEVMRPSLRLRCYYALSRVLLWLVLGLGRFRHAVTRDNLARSFPDLTPAQRRDIERDYIRRQSEVFAEIFYGFSISAEELRARVVVLNPQLLADAQPPRPLVLAGAHHGNFEWMLLRLSLELGPRLLGLYKPLKNPRADSAFLRLRSRFGARLIPAKSVLQELARFREAGAIGLVADQVPRTSPEKHWVRFLRQDTAFYMGPELMARALRSRALFVRMRRRARGTYTLEFVPLHEAGEKLPSGTITERYARELEAWIEGDPPGWWWSHRRWKMKRGVY